MSETLYDQDRCVIIREDATLQITVMPYSNAEFILYSLIGISVIVGLLLYLLIWAFPVYASTFIVFAIGLVIAYLMFTLMLSYYAWEHITITEGQMIIRYGVGPYRLIRRVYRYSEMHGLKIIPEAFEWQQYSYLFSSNPERSRYSAVAAGALTFQYQGKSIHFGNLLDGRTARLILSHIWPYYSPFHTEPALPYTLPKPTTPRHSYKLSTLAVWSTSQRNPDVPTEIVYHTPRCSILYEGTNLAAVVRGKLDFPPVHYFMMPLVGLSMVMICGVTAIPLLMILVGLGAASVIISMIIWVLAGWQRIEATPDTLRIRFGIGPLALPFPRSYPMYSINRLQVSPAAYFYSDSEFAPRFYSAHPRDWDQSAWQRGAITFDYGAQTIHIAGSLDTQSAEAIVAYLWPYVYGNCTQP